jgi:hypothetical protein
MSIIERRPMYSNKMMVEYCDTLRKIITSSKADDKGVVSNKYRSSASINDSIEKSYEHYKQLYENEMGKKYNSVKFWDYQQHIIAKGVAIMNIHRFIYLAMEVRTGKTLTSLGILDELPVENVLFITKKKAMGSITNDYRLLNPSFDLTVINYESLHLVEHNKKWDAIVVDEAHSLGAFAKPSNRALAVKNVIARNAPYVILMSGTPTPESYSQMYHQVYGIPNNPFAKYINFYKFCHDYVNVGQKRINGMFINDYSNGKKEIIDAMSPYTINYTQSEAGFNVEIEEHVLEVEMKPSTYKLIDRLKKDLVIEGAVNTILADTPVKLMSKMHQLYSGTIKFESGDSMIIDDTKAQFIKEHFADKRIGIFYKFKEELKALKAVFGDDMTDDLTEFDAGKRVIALQIVSGREGISLRNAEALVYYNIDFSATSYWQSRDRMTTKERLENNVYWVFSKDGIEHEIYKTVRKKKDFTLAHFKKNFYESK